MNTITQTIEREGAIGRAFKRLMNASDREIAAGSGLSLATAWKFRTGRTPYPDVHTLDALLQGRGPMFAARIREARAELEAAGIPPDEATRIVAALLREMSDVGFRELRGPIAPAPDEAATPDPTLEEVSV